MKITQSLIKAIQDPNHCPKQIYYSFVEGLEVNDPTEPQLIGRYFESELLGACRGGEKQKPKMIGIKSKKPSKHQSKKIKLEYLHSKGVTNLDNLTSEELFFEIAKMPDDYTEGEKASAYIDCDKLIEFARSVFDKLGINLSEGESQFRLESEFLVANIDHVNTDLVDSSIKANYDLKWTATKEDDRWNGWGDPESKLDAIIQAAHYTLTSYEVYGEWRPFYFIIFGKDKWVKIIRYKFTKDSIQKHKERIAYTASKIKEYAKTKYKGVGTLNKCVSCRFYEVCSDKSTIPEIETITIN